MLDQNRLQEVLRYEPETGEFFWLKRQGSRARNDLIGKPAGTQNSYGYIQIMIDRKGYGAQRLAWLYTYGKWPKNQIDHIDRNRSNNRIANLREATMSQQQANSKTRQNRSGWRGVWHTRDQKWRAQIRRNGRQYTLGYFDSAEAAHRAYCEEAKKLDGEFFYSGQAK